MKRKILTLNTGAIKGQRFANAPPTLVAGRPNKAPSALLLKHLHYFADLRHRVFIQMRDGTGYCGQIDSFDAGWLSMRDTTVHGTKKKITVPDLLVHALDGRQIAHIHKTDTTEIGVTK